MHQIAIKTLTEPCRPELLCYCPTMDLVATVTEKQAVNVWRLNGQRVFGLMPDVENAPQVVGLIWKSDGQILAVACSDGIIRLINSFSGKVVRRLQTGALPLETSSVQSTTQQLNQNEILPSICTMSWTSHFSNPEIVQQQLMEAPEEVTLDDLLSLNADISKLLKAKADLPRELAAIDVEISLPKLATLPATGSDDDVFSARSSIDAIFHSSNRRGGTSVGKVDVVDVWAIGLPDCSMHLRVFDSFEIGNVQLSAASHKSAKPQRIVGHGSNAFVQTHFIIIEDTETTARKRSGDFRGAKSTLLHLTSLDIRIIPQTSYNLPLVANKATQLQNLLRYLTQIKSQLSQEVDTAFELPRKFLNNIDESLAEQDNPSDFISTAYHLAVTGECVSRVKEWLVDEVGERGLKRWEKAVGDCLDMAKRMTSECLLPAIERCQVVLSRLEGLAKFSSTSTKLGIDGKGIRLIRDTLDILAILSEDMLKDICVEIKEFAVFMKWMKWEAEVQSLEEGSERAEELRETWAGETDLKMVLEYISGAMKKTRLTKYFGGVESSLTNHESLIDSDGPIYLTFKDLRKASSKHNTLPKLAHLLSRMQLQCDDVFTKIAETLRKSILVTSLYELPENLDKDILEIKILPMAKERQACQILIAARNHSNPTEIIHLVLDLNSDNGRFQKVTSASQQCLKLPETDTVLDMKYIDADSLLVLTAQADKRRIFSGCPMATGMDGSSSSLWKLRHIFEDVTMNSPMRPAKLEVNDRKGRRVAVVVDEKGAGYIVLDLDSGHEDSPGQERIADRMAD